MTDLSAVADQMNATGFRPTADPAQDAQRFIDNLPDEAPDPVGHRLLIAVYTPPKQTSGGIIKPDEHHERERASAQIGFVLAMGPTAYDQHLDPEYRDAKYRGGPWCQVHDWVVLPKWERLARVKVPDNDELEFRFLNDDEIVATLTSPTLVQPY